MSRAEHYQFFPIFVVGIVWFFISDFKEISDDTSVGSDRISTFVYVLIALLLGLATIVNSSFLGAISFWIFLATTVYWLMGMDGLRRSLPLLLLLLLIIPLPAKLDELLIFRLQFLASQLGSLILDGLGLVHFREGVILVTENDQFLTEEACSGIRSMFSSLTGIGFYCLISYYKVWRYLFNFVQTIFWVVAGNGLRIALVVFISDRYTRAIATGIGHDLFGLLMFVFIMAMAISTDRLLQSVLHPGRVDLEEPSPASDQAPSQAISQRLFSKFGFASIAFVLYPVLISTFAIGTLVSINKLTYQNGIWITGLPRLSQPSQNDLTTKLWQIQDFEFVQREEGGIQAEDSSIWTLSQSELEARFSLDCPWEDWHDLSHCYSGLGWTVELEHVFDNLGEEQGYSILRMSKPTGEHGIVCFSCVDKSGSEVVPRFTGGFFSFQSVYRQIVETLFNNLGFENNGSGKGIGLPVTTFQLVCERGQEFSDEDHEDIKELFFECRKSLLNSSRFSNK